MMLQCKIGIGELCEELLINSSFYLDHTVLMITLPNSVLVHVACLQACACLCSVQNIGSLAVCMHCFYRVIKSLCAPDNYSTKKHAKIQYFKQFHHRIHLECGPCYTEHGLREHSSACQCLETGVGHFEHYL